MTTKCIILKDGKEIVGKSLIDVGAGTSGPSRAIEAVLEDAGLKKEDMAFTLATGYGRTSLMDGIADKMCCRWFMRRWRSAGQRLWRTV